ncbi:MAG: glycosyl hydrolase 53 family protein [Prevotellaceae bacterium]|nr:glycosyl hydrolase 53 family protein [Candidatus Minthosoma caballi]
MKKITTLALLILFAMSVAAQDKNTFTFGADISWYTEMVSSGYSFAKGTKKMSCPELLREYGINAARFRVWVNPASKYNGKDDVVKKAKAATECGLDVFIDFHMSDTWADPESQVVPKAWEKDSYAEMKAHLAEHVKDVLSALVAEGVEPRWVQIGNETNNGMLWNLGKASEKPAQYAGFINEGYNAVKSVCPNAQVVVHVSNGFDQSLFDWNIGILKNNKAKYDIIGMSLYPGNDDSTAETIDKTIKNIRHLSTSFGKKVMIVEVGLPINSGSKGKSIMADILNRAQNDTNKGCVGVLYWEPEAPSGWNHYQMGASIASSKVIKFTSVMDAFAEAAEATSIVAPAMPTQNNLQSIYSINGTKLNAPIKGLNIINGKKVFVK